MAGKSFDFWWNCGFTTDLLCVRQTNKMNLVGKAGELNSKADFKIF